MGLTKKMVKEMTEREKDTTVVATSGILSSFICWLASALMRQYCRQA